ncbi:radical SAM protein [Candidatus Woesearchaeota archaeon]|nr:radical SAM protein [Candidatus Woesearchaeota archaeon]
MFKRVDVKTGFSCNNNCLFCVQADNKLKNNRSFNDIKEDLEDSRKRCDGVVLTGGEVTIRKDFFDIVTLAKKLDYKTVQVQTNARMFANLDFCKKTIATGATEFSPALHGHDAAQHDFLTQTPGSFVQTIKGIKNLKALNAKILTNTVVTQQNYQDLPKIAQLLVKLGVDQFQFAFIHPMGNAWKNFDQVVPSISKAAPYIHQALSIGAAAGITVMAEAMPYCHMQGYEDYIAEKVIPEAEIRGSKHQNTDSFTTQRKVYGKQKFVQCKKCYYDNVCEGPWKEYPQKKGNEEFTPLEKKYALFRSNVLNDMRDYIFDSKKIQEKLKLSEKILFNLSKKKTESTKYLFTSMFFRVNKHIMITPKKFRELWREKIRNNTLSSFNLFNLYLHIPFCKTKCDYCMYYSTENKTKKEIDDYLENLIKKIKYFSPVFSKIIFQNVFIGGGTPSILDEKQLHYLLSNIYKHYTFNNDGEINFEVNPTSITSSKLKILKKYGFNRISMGVQSLDPKVLEYANRKNQDYQKIKETIELAKSLGLEVNIDLMIGLQHDNPEKLLSSFNKIMNMRPQSISLYPLKPSYEYLKYHYSQDEKKFFDYINNEIIEFLKIIKPIAKKHDYTTPHLITISEGYCGTFRDKKTSNIKKKKKGYYTNVPYSIFGLGPNSLSKISGIFRCNEIAIQNSKFNENSLSYSGSVATIKDDIRDYILDNFAKKSPLIISNFKKVFGTSIFEVFPQTLHFLIKENKVNIKDDKLIFLPNDFNEIFKYGLLFWNKKELNNFLNYTT